MISLGIRHWYVVNPHILHLADPVKLLSFCIYDIEKCCMQPLLGNDMQVKQLHEWLAHWNEQFLHTGTKGKGKKQNDSGAKKAVLLSGTPGIGKTTSAKLVSQMLGFQAIEVAN